MQHAVAIFSGMWKQPGREATYRRNGPWWVVALACLAEQRGFQLVTRLYKGSRERYTWRCGSGHEWRARYDSLLCGKGCPTCYIAAFPPKTVQKANKRAADRAYYAAHKLEKRVYDRSRRAVIGEELRQYDRQRYARNPRRHDEAIRRYVASGKLAKNAKRRYREDVQFRLALLLRNRVNRSLRRGSAVRDLGCTIAELKLHLERLFQPGMTWENHGSKGWHIDHIRPLASFDLMDRRQFLQAVHYTNLQPMWAGDNLRKGAR